MIDSNVNATYVPSPVFEGLPGSPSLQSVPLTSNLKAQSQAANAPSSSGQSNMKKWLWILAIVFAAAAAFGQTDNTLYARNFPGPTVGVKVTNAQNACNSDTSQKCIIVIDASLSAFPDGTMPSRCSNCVWWDLRQGSDFPGLALTTTGSGAATLNNGVLNIPNASANSANSYSLNPAGTLTILTGDSFTNDDINALQQGTETVHGWNCPGDGECSIGLSSTAAYAVGDYVFFPLTQANPTTTSITPVNNDCTAAIQVDRGLGYSAGYGPSCGWYKILSTGFTSTSFEIAYSGAATSCSSSCGNATVSNADAFVGPTLQGESAMSGHGTVMWLPDSNAYTVASLSTDFATWSAGIPNGTANAPVRLVIGAWSNDVADNESYTTIEGDLASIFAQCHAKNWECFAATMPPLFNAATVVLVNNWIRQQSETTANQATGQYEDWQFDAGPRYVPWKTYWSANGSLDPSGVSRMAQFMNIAFGLNIPIDSSQVEGKVDGGNNSVSYFPTGADFYGYNWYGGGNYSSGDQVTMMDDNGNPLIVTSGSGASSGLIPVIQVRCPDDNYASGTQVCGILVGNSWAGSAQAYYGANNTYAAAIPLALMGLTGGTPVGVQVSGELNDLYYKNTTCISGDSAGNLVAGCPGITSDISTTPDTATPSTFPSIQSISGAGCTTGANSYDSCDVTLTWPKAFADAAYQVTCTADTPSVTQTGCTGTSGCQMGTIAGTTKTATTVTVIWETNGANAATATNFNCIAMQNTGQ